MVKAGNAGSAEEAVDIVVDEVKLGANKINAQTPYDFDGRKPDGLRRRHCWRSWASRNWFTKQ